MDNPENLNPPKTASDLLVENDAIRTENRRLEALLSQMVDLNREQEKEHSERVSELLTRADKTQRLATAFMSICHLKSKPIPSLYGCTEEQLGEIAEAVIKYTTLGCDFEVIVDAIQDNPLIASEWERFTSFLRFVE